jgi:hypothetical protein
MTAPVPALPSVHEVQRAYYEELDAHEKGALLSWASFTATFVGVRAITYSIKDGHGPFHDLKVGAAHLHHYMWGIAGLTVLGGAAVRGTGDTREHPVLAVAYGAALALIVDEFALLLDLSDVYWLRQGRLSVDIGISVVAAGGTSILALPILRRLARDRRGSGVQRLSH